MGHTMWVAFGPPLPALWDPLRCALQVDLVKCSDFEIYICQEMTTKDYAGKYSQAVVNLAE